jgi:outer membrane receptor for monomeric catechols
MPINRRSRHFFSFLTVITVSQAALSSPQNSNTSTADVSAIDMRSYQHGIDFVPLPDGNYYLIWSSSGNPPTGAKPDGSWPHDIYYSKINPENPKIIPKTLVSNQEA